MELEIGRESPNGKRSEAVKAAAEQVFSLKPACNFRRSTRLCVWLTAVILLAVAGQSTAWAQNIPPASAAEAHGPQMPRGKVIARKKIPLPPREGMVGLTPEERAQIPKSGAKLGKAPKQPKVGTHHVPKQPKVGKVKHARKPRHG